MAKSVSGGVANQPNTPYVHFGYGRNDGWFDAQIRANGERVISSPFVEEDVVNHDRIEDVSQPGVFAQDFDIDVTIYPRPDDTDQQPVASITDNGGVRISELSPYKLETVADGISEVVTLTTQSRTLELQVEGSTRNAGSPVETFKGFVAGTLAYHCEHSINSRIGNATTDMLPIFTNYSSSHASGNYTRNPDCWAYDLRQAMTCISPWNSNASNRKAGTALTKRHIANAAHYEYPVGTTVRFVTANNVTVTRTIIGKKRHPDYSSYFPDITIYLLDSDLPESITPCKVLPANYADYMPTGPKQIAALCLDQEEKALVTDLKSFSSIKASFIYPDTAEEQVLYEGKIVGDSGNPAFLIVDGELVCITLWTYGGAGAGTFLTPQISTMNQMIVDLDTAAGISTGYTLTEIDLTSYLNFSTGNYLIENSDLDNGNASLWVEDGTANGKTAYKLRGVSGDSTLEWTGSVWEARDSEGTLLDSSADDVATPDLASFSTLQFSTPS